MVIFRAWATCDNSLRIMKRVTGVTQSEEKKEKKRKNKSLSSHQKTHRNTSKENLLIYFIEKNNKKNQWYLAFADLSILFLLQSLNGRL